MKETDTQGTPHPRRARPRGVLARRRILETAARLASVEGLEGLSIGGLAKATGMSKSGLYAHFEAKQDLQLATIDVAREIFVDVVMRPALAQPGGVERLRAVLYSFLDHVDQRVFPGGCFFVAVGVEMAGRTGAVRDRIAKEQRDWIGTLEALVTQARDLGQLSAATDPPQLAFELNAVVVAANAAFVLHSDRTALERARRAVDQLLAHATGV